MGQNIFLFSSNARVGLATLAAGLSVHRGMMFGHCGAGAMRAGDMVCVGEGDTMAFCMRDVL